MDQKRSLLQQTAGHADMVDTEEAATGEGDVPRRVEGKHTNDRSDVS